MMPTPPFAAVVFDMDGVLADSEPVYYRAFNSVLQPLGKKVTEGLKRRAMGHGVDETWRIMAEGLGLGSDYQPLVDAYDAALLVMLAKVHDTLPGVRELIDALRVRSLPIGMASSSRPAWIEALLGGVGLRDAFDAIVPRVEVPNGKPAPDVYVEAARRLGVAPQRCIAIEDTPPGIASGVAAGMYTIQVRSSSEAFPPQPKAHLVLESLLDFDLALIGG